MISVVVPVLNHLEVTFSFLQCIAENTILPKEIILVDNRSVEPIYRLVSDFPQLPITYIRPSQDLGVNAAWNLGMTMAKTPLISILNNDILINPFFFERTIAAFENERHGIVVPMTVSTPDRLLSGVNKTKSVEDESLDLHFPVKRYGWAFSLRKSLINRIKPIPAHIIPIECGDDYLFICAKNTGFLYVMDFNNRIYHYGGLSGIGQGIAKKDARYLNRKYFKKVKDQLTTEAMKGGSW